MTLEEPIFFFNRQGDRLAGVLHHPPAGQSLGAVIVCHGMESNKNSEKLVLLSRLLTQRGILTLRFDFRYVGESSGDFADLSYGGEVEDLRAAYSLLQHRQAGKIAILGSSMGGTVALMFAAQEPSVAALVTIAAPLHPENFSKRVLTLPQFQQWRDQGFTIYNGQRLNLTLLDELERINVPELVRQIHCPVLILHGDADEVVPVEEAYELHSCLTTPKQLSILKDADHRLSNPAVMQRAIGDALEWLTDHVR